MPCTLTVNGATAPEIKANLRAVEKIINAAGGTEVRGETMRKSPDDRTARLLVHFYAR